MANDELCKDLPQLSRFHILRTFSIVKRGMMARFMSAVTWKAAWLRHCFHWDRVVVGYALSGEPERVMEVYGIPEEDIGRAQSMLKELHAQAIYQQMLDMCREDPLKINGREVMVRQHEEKLLPSMKYKTLMHDVIQQRRCEFELVGKRAESKREFTKKNQELVDQTELVNTLRGKVVALGAELAQGGLEPRKAEELKADRDNLQRRIDDIELPKKADLEEERTQISQALEATDRKIIEARKNRKFGDFDIPAYFLEVTTRVKSESLEAYIQKMTELSRDFKWQFIAAGEHPEPDEGAGRGTEHEIMHLWRFGNADALYQQMVEMRENQRYSEIEPLIEHQSHTLMCEWEALSKTRKDPAFPEFE